MSITTLAAPTPDDVVIRASCKRFLDRAEAIRDAHTTAAVVALGKVALDELYGGSWERAGTRGPTLDAPLAMLTAEFGEHMGWIGLTVDQIRTALRAYSVDRQLPPASKGRLLPTSLRALAGIVDPSDRIELANRAAVERWPVDKVVAEVATWRSKAGVRSRGGRPTLGPAVKAARAAGRSVAAIAAMELASFDAEARVAAVGELEALRDAVERELARLGGGR